MEIAVSDWGRAFLGAPDVRNPDPASASGRGLYIISRLVDDAQRQTEQLTALQDWVTQQIDTAR